jgi:hypothetical protein
MIESVTTARTNTAITKRQHNMQDASFAKTNGSSKGLIPIVEFAQ